MIKSRIVVAFRSKFGTEVQSNLTFFNDIFGVIFFDDIFGRIIFIFTFLVSELIVRLVAELILFRISLSLRFRITSKYDNGMGFDLDN